jgi:hypothetical protein
MIGMQLAALVLLVPSILLLFVLDTALGELPISLGEPSIVKEHYPETTEQPVVGWGVKIKSELRNSSTNELIFTYLVQVKNEENVTVSLRHTNGTVSGNNLVNVDLLWTPELAGKYSIETFVWSSVSDPVPLAASKIINTEVISKAREWRHVTAPPDLCDTSRFRSDANLGEYWEGLEVTPGKESYSVTGTFINPSKPVMEYKDAFDGLSHFDIVFFEDMRFGYNTQVSGSYECDIPVEVAKERASMLKDALESEFGIRFEGFSIEESTIGVAFADGTFVNYDIIIFDFKVIRMQINFDSILARTLHVIESEKGLASLFTNDTIERSHDVVIRLFFSNVKYGAAFLDIGNESYEIGKRTWVVLINLQYDYEIVEETDDERTVKIDLKSQMKFKDKIRPSPNAEKSFLFVPRNLEVPYTIEFIEPVLYGNDCQDCAIINMHEVEEMNDLIALLRVQKI